MGYDYDVIIVGASFAGLAVASQLEKKKILLLDHKEVGESQTSACGTLLYVVEALGLRQTVLQVHPKLSLHVGGKTFEYKMAYPFCTVDYKKFCQGLLKKTKNLEMKKAQVSGFAAETVKTDQGDFSATFLVDASGWSAVLGKQLAPTLVDKNHLSFGLETEVEYQEEGLHFWYEPNFFKKGVFWLFPAGQISRFGIWSYEGKTQIKEKLEEFLGRFNLKIGNLHGGFFTAGLRRPVVGDVFLVGDAAGQCLPLTGEGIRPGVFFGIKLGQIIQASLEKEITFAEAQKFYQDFVFSRAKYYHYLFWAQKILTTLPDWGVKILARLIGERQILEPFFHRYFELARLS